MRPLMLMQWQYLGNSNEVRRSMKSWKTSRRFLLQQHVVEQRPDNVSNQYFQTDTRGVKIVRIAGHVSMVTDRVRFTLIAPVVASRVLSRKTPRTMLFSISYDQVE